MEPSDYLLIKRVIAIAVLVSIIFCFILYARLKKKVGMKTMFYTPSQFLAMLAHAEFYIILVLLIAAVFLGLTMDALQHG